MTIKSLLSLLTRQTSKHDQTCLTRHPNYLAGLETDLSRTEEVEPQLVWIKRHKNEVRMLHRIIQLEMHFSARLFHYDNAEEQPMLLSVSSSAAQTLKIDDCIRELDCLRDDFITLLHRVTDFEKAKPSGIHIDKYVKKAQQQENLRPHNLWRFEMIYCQLSEGCCSCNCGCCERSWRTIRDHSNRVHYLHCSQDFGCCSRRRATIKVS